MDDLLQEFIAETRETLEALSGEIIAWEAAPDDRGRLDSIFRFVHTVKGSCGFLDLPRLLRLSHAAEDVLSDVRDGKRRPDRELVNAVLAVVDRIGELVEAIDAGTPLDDGGEGMLIAALRAGSDRVAAAQSATPGTPLRPAQRSVRLNVDLLDRMMSGMSEMVLARNDLARRLRETDLNPRLEAALERLSGTVAEMRDAVTRTRMMKIETLFSALPRMVRDTAASLGKSVSLTLDGSDVELDREMIEVMRDPLLHIVRNAIDHGIETPAERRAAGKREKGRLHIGARQSGNQIVVEVFDDGRGIDTERLVRKLIETEQRSEAELRQLSEAERCGLVFEPGLSSRDHVTDFSGRGVGMDVVKSAIDQIGGRVTLDNSPGVGLRITVQVPLTLSIISTIGIEAAGHRFAIPRQAIGEIVSGSGDNIRIDMVGDALVAAVRDRRMPIVDLGGLIGVADGIAKPHMLVVVEIGAGTYGLVVDQVLDTEELVVKPAAPPVMAAGIYAGQTLPDNGCPMLLLDCTAIAQVAGLRFATALQAEDEDTQGSEPGIPALMFRDLDGARRVLPLSVIDRIDRVDVSALRMSAGQLRLSMADRVLPAEAIGDYADLDEVAVLRLTDGAHELAYVIADAIDIVSLHDMLVPADVPGPIAGVLMLDGELVEQVDPLWLFNRHIDVPEPDGGRPVCLVDDSPSGWMAVFLRPMLEQAGYQVTARLGAGESASIVLIDADKPVAPGAPVVRLRTSRREEHDGTVYRYDREGLLRAVRAAAGGTA